MKILITSDLYTTKTNGVVTSLLNLTEQLLAMGHDVRILSFSDTRRDKRDDRAYLLGSRSIGWVYPNLRMPRRLYRHRYIKELIRWKPDVIHSQCEFFSFQYARYISEAVGAPLVHTYHSLYEQYVPYLIPSRRFGEYLVRTVSRRRLAGTAAVIAPTEKVRAALGRYRVDAPISVIPSGLRLEQHRSPISDEERSELRRRHGIREEQTVLLNLGRLGTEKNIEELLTLLAPVLQEDDSLVFMVVGDGPDREHLEAFARELGIGSRVIFTGMVSPADVHRYYRIADIFLCASTSETQGLTYIEAAANRLPLLCRRDPCLDGVLLEGENGFAYTDAEEFSEGLRQLMDDAFRRRAGEISEQISRRYGCEDFAKAVETVYETSLDQTTC